MLEVVPSQKEGMKRTSTLSEGYVLQERYQVSGIIGKGGMGAIYLAQDQRFTNRLCAIKEMQDIFTDDEERKFAIEGFYREQPPLSGDGVYPRREYR